MLDPVKLANDIKSIEFRLGALVEELRGINSQTSVVKISIDNLKKDNYYTKNTLEETKYAIEIIKFELKELKDPIDGILASLKSILRVVRVVSIAALVGAALLADSYFNWFEQFLIFSRKFF